MYALASEICGVLYYGASVNLVEKDDIPICKYNGMFSFHLNLKSFM